jgi:hypothetical protein
MFLPKLIEVKMQALEK